MHWKDEGFLLSKNNFDENSVLIETFTLNHGKCTGIVYGGSSRKQKKNFQVGNKILLHWESKAENRSGYFNIELINPIAAKFFDDKKRSVCILSSASILRILLPERQINKKIYNSFDKMLSELNFKNWINLYIHWELSLIKDLGYETVLSNKKNLEYKDKNFIKVNNRSLKIPKMLFNQYDKVNYDSEIKEALIFNKNLLMENFILPNKLRFPLFRKILEKYYN